MASEQGELVPGVRGETVLLHSSAADRNGLLGDLLEATSTSVIALSADQAVICSDAGDVCLLEDTEKAQRPW